MADLGRQVARLDAALADFSHPAMRRKLLWNLERALEVAQWSELIEPRMRGVVDAVFARYREQVAPRLADLPHQAIHNDANELNVLVDAAVPSPD